jgi:hypothetical protein
MDKNTSVTRAEGGLEILNTALRNMWNIPNEVFDFSLQNIPFGLD